MANLTKTELIDQIDWERRENNAKFVSPTQTVALMNRAIKRLLREPGIRTVQGPAYSITAVNGTSSYTLPTNFKELISIWSGEGQSRGIKFEYKPEDEYHAYQWGFIFTFLLKGYIDIKFPDAGSLPTTSLTLRYWANDIVLDEDGSTTKMVFEKDGDTLRTDAAFDDFVIMWVVSRILRREGKKEWKDYDAEATEILEMLKEAPASKTRRPRSQFGVMM